MKKKSLIALVSCLIFYQQLMAQVPNDDGSWNNELSEEFSYYDANDRNFNRLWTFGYRWGMANDNAHPLCVVSSTHHTFGGGSGYLRLTVQYDPRIHNTNLAYGPNGWYWEQGYYNYAFGLISSRKKYHFGYFEASIQAADGEFHGGFWLYGADCIDEERYYNEIDIFEPDGSFYPLTDIPSNYHYAENTDCEDSSRGAYPKWHRGFPNLAATYHNYSVEWTPNYIIWYVDNEPIRFEIDLNNVPQNPMEIINGSGISTYYGPYAKDSTSTESLPAAWDTDYIRHYTADIRSGSNPYIINATVLNTYTSDPHVAKTLVCDAPSMITVNTSDEITLRSSDYVTIEKNFTVNPNNSGHFTILVPDYN